MTDPLKEYRVKVTYKYSDIVYVNARSKEEALAMAPDEAAPQEESLYDCEILSEEVCDEH